MCVFSVPLVSGSGAAAPGTRLHGGDVQATVHDALISSFRKRERRHPPPNLNDLEIKKVECSCDWFPGITWVGFYKELRLAN